MMLGEGVGGTEKGGDLRMRVRRMNGDERGEGENIIRGKEQGNRRTRVRDPIYPIRSYGIDRTKDEVKWYVKMQYILCENDRHTSPEGNPCSEPWSC